MTVEKRTRVVLEAMAIGESQYETLLRMVRRMSKYSRLIRAMAWMFRFISHAMKGKVVSKAFEQVHGINTSCLTTEEIEIAEVLLIQAVQKDAFSDTYFALKNGELIKDVPVSSKKCSTPLAFYILSCLLLPLMQDFLHHARFLKNSVIH